MGSVTYVATLFLSTLFLVSGDDTAVWKDDIRGWEIRVDPSLNNSCLMTTAFQDGSVIRAQFNMNSDNFQFIIGNNKWQSIEHGKVYDMSVEFGNAGPWHGQASAHFFGSMPALIFSVTFEEGRAELFIDEFMKMGNVMVRYNNRDVANLSLRGTYAAMTEVFACQQAMIGGASTASDPFYSPPRSDDPFR